MVNHIHYFACDSNLSHIIPMPCRFHLAICKLCGSKGRNVVQEVTYQGGTR